MMEMQIRILDKMAHAKEWEAASAENIRGVEWNAYKVERAFDLSNQSIGKKEGSLRTHA
jgi:hypothetical protein